MSRTTYSLGGTVVTKYIVTKYFELLEPKARTLHHHSMNLILLFIYKKSLDIQCLD